MVDQVRVATRKPRYVLCPGLIRSQYDGQKHHISAGQLARLYELRRGEWEPWREGVTYPQQTVFLHPSPGGHYGRPAPQRPAPSGQHL